MDDDDGRIARSSSRRAEATDCAAATDSTPTREDAQRTTGHDTGSRVGERFAEIVFTLDLTEAQYLNARD